MKGISTENRSSRGATKKEKAWRRTKKRQDDCTWKYQKGAWTVSRNEMEKRRGFDERIGRLFIKGKEPPENYADGNKTCKMKDYDWKMYFR